MAVTTEKTREDYDGNGSTTAFAVGFYFLKDTHLEVILVQTDGAEITQVLNSDYTVTGAGNPAGGSISMNIAPASGERLAILRDMPLTQETELTANGDLPAKTLEQTYDYSRMVDQQIDEGKNRTLRLTKASKLTAPTVPDPETDKALVGNEAGDGYVNKNIVPAGSLAVPVGISDGGHGATTQSGAQTNLGIGTAGLADTGTADAQIPTNLLLPSMNYKIFTADGNFVKATDLPANVKDVVVWVLGGGAGGGGANTSTNYRGVGGGSGGFTMKRIAVSALLASEPVTVGAAGTGGTSGASPTAGTNGETSQFGTHCSATGGTGGVPASGSAIGGVPGGIGVGGDLVLPGGTSGTMSNNGGANSDEVSPGGDSPMGLGQGGQNVTEAGKGYGAGGAPGANSGVNAGNGAPGLVIVWW